MTETQVLEQADRQDVAETLRHPDPDHEALPAIIPPELVQQEQTAAHIMRASLRLDEAIVATKARMDADLAAWGAELAKLQAKRDQWRELVRAWMVRTGTTQIKCPFFVASLTKGRTKKVIPDEAAFIARCKEVGYTKAIKIMEKLVKAEADIIADTMPDKFAGLFTEETGEPGLTVRRAKE